MTDQTQPPTGSTGQGQQPIPPKNVVRPGQDVPVGGIDPTEVFASPPPPPAGQGDDGSQPPAKDQGPPPPPPGPLPADEELKAAGYDDEDIKILRQIGDYRFGSIAGRIDNQHIVSPEHPETQFDEQLFLTLLRGSISLTRDEKWRIVQAIPKLSQFQIDELQKILSEERRKFSMLSPKHLIQLQKLEQKHAEDWRDLQSINVQQDVKQEEASQADEIRKQLGL